MTRAYFTGHVTRADASFGRRVLCTKCNMYANAEFKEDKVDDDEEEFVCDGCMKIRPPYEYVAQRPAPNLHLVAVQKEPGYERRQAA